MTPDPFSTAATPFPRPADPFSTAGKFLKKGDKLEAEVERIGVLANRVVAP